MKREKSKILVFYEGSKKRIQLDHEEVMSRSSMASVSHVNPQSIQFQADYRADERRRWMDRILSMVHPSYLKNRLN